jgi:UPF0755 protein
VADGRERTAQEREAARLERERRRTGVFNEPDDGHEPHDGYAQDEPDDGYAPHELDDGHEPHEPHEPPELAEPHEPDDVYEPLEPPEGYEPLEPPEPIEPAERASGTRRVSRLERGSKRPRHQRPVRKRRPVVAGRRRHSWLVRLMSLVALIAAGALIWFLVELFQPLGTSPHGRVTVVIPAHQGARQIGDLLAQDKVIPSGFFFELRAGLAGERGDLRPGTYHLQEGISYAAALTALTKVPRAAKTSQVTLSEGHTRAYIAKLLAKQKIKGNYLAATRRSKLLDPHRYGAPRHVPSLEGFLFPDTFTLVDPIKVSVLVDDQLRDFKQRFAKVNLGYARSKHLTPYEVLTVASLIEAEAASQKARPLIASVIYNRLADHMMLQFDSTTRYATGNFTRPLKVSQLNSHSPYNTHTHFGLPPTPIDSPGVAAIQAAAHPARTHYLYFFAKPCSNASVFATSYTQFQHLLLVDRRNHCG